MMENKVHTNLDFVNAQEMAEKYPDTFEVPSDEELKSLKKGDFAKVCLNDERFWVRILFIEGECYTGTVDNILVFNKEIAYGDMVTFQLDNVYATIENVTTVH